MIKKTLYFGNPCYLKKKQDQLLMEYAVSKEASHSISIEDIGMIILDNLQITITQGLLTALNANNVAILNCDHKHLPTALMLPMASHHAFTEKIRYQIESSLPLRKNLWQQTIIAKIRNQAALIKIRGGDPKRLQYLSTQVKSGDKENAEARAASWYWKALFNETDTFKRERFGDAPNNLLNYGYAILRGVVARSLTASGLLNTIGIHHRNKYNPFCLADDIMEPYRPYVDKIVIEMAWKYDDIDTLSKEFKAELLSIPVIDIMIDGNKSPLMVGMKRTTASLMQCFEGKCKNILYPDLAKQDE
jgi:CRISPR-associated protein Cas1